MKRREVLKAIASLPVCHAVQATSTAQAACAQFNTIVPGEISKFAVVIGVNRTVRLPELNAAASGALDISQWLQKEGFTVAEFVDERIDENESVIQCTVRLHHITDIVIPYLRSPAITDLVVYFGGHGFNRGENEIWLLSQAPENSTEAISYFTTRTHIAKLNIPNVTFISDACRSITDDVDISDIHGASLAPNVNTLPNRFPDIDEFFAASRGQSAFEGDIEVSTDDRVELHNAGVFTLEFLRSYRNKSLKVTNEKGVDIIPSRKMRPHLEVAVPTRAQKLSLRAIQRPFIRVQSADLYSIGRHHEDLVVTMSPTNNPNNSISNLTMATASTEIDVTIPEWITLRKADLNQDGVDIFSELPEINENATFKNDDADAILESVLDALRSSYSQTLELESDSDAVLFVHGDAIKEYKVMDTSQDLVTEWRATDGTTRIRSIPSIKSSVFIKLESDIGTVVGNFPGYVCNVIVNERRIISVSYYPNPQYNSLSESRLERLFITYANVAAVSHFNSFEIEGTREERIRKGEALGDAIRIDKSVDPTLGIYAAYAYLQAGLLNDVQSVDDFMFTTRLFDVAMLAGRLDESHYPFVEVAPCCPMLSRGWELLDAHSVDLPPYFKKARSFLRNALWTTFEGEGIDLLLENV